MKKAKKTFDDIGQVLVPGVLNDTKRIRKAGADIFANVRPEKTEQKIRTLQRNISKI